MKNFWDKYAFIYDKFMEKDKKAYDRMCELIKPNVKNKFVLEVATGTGLIANKIAHLTKGTEATDYSPEMIKTAKKCPHSSKLHFSLQDMFNLSYADKTFQVVIISNALHIIKEPEKALRELSRVLTDDGILIAPTFTHRNSGIKARISLFFMKLLGFPLESEWTSEEYIDFLSENGFTAEQIAVIKSSFPLTYVKCTKKFNQKEEKIPC